MLLSNFSDFDERTRQQTTNTRKHSTGSLLYGHGRVRTFQPDRTLVPPMRGTSSVSRFSGTRPVTPMNFGCCHDHRRPSKVNWRPARSRKTFSRRSSRGNWPNDVRWHGDWIRPGPPGFVTSPRSSRGGCVPGMLTSTSSSGFWRKRTPPPCVSGIFTEAHPPTVFITSNFQNIDVTPRCFRYVCDRFG
jgi:hypothetical protein